MAASLDRRQFLGRSLVAGAGVAAFAAGGSTLLAACSSDSKTSSSTATTGGSGSANYGPLNYQLSWIKNVEFAGQYIADTNGYYTKNGFSSVNLISGGPNVTQDAVVASGNVLVGVSDPAITAPAILQGAPIIIIGAQYQKSPFAIMSLTTNPIPNPQAMVGKKIGVQSTNTSVFTAFLKANNIAASSVNVVPVQFDPTPLTTGTVDGWFSFITNEPITLKEKGFPTTTFLLNDFNFPSVSQVYVVQTSSLKSKRDALKALLLSEIAGWHDSLANPATGANLAVTNYGKDLGLDVGEQTLESAAQNQLILTDRTKTDGIFTMTQAMVADNIKTLGLGGTTITADKLFDLSLINEVYSENPSLKTSPS